VAKATAKIGFHEIFAARPWLPAGFAAEPVAGFSDCFPADSFSLREKFTHGR
jgi:hypothetical protein